MLIDLIEHLEAIDGFELIQSSTDGLIISLPDTDEAFNQMDDICYEWENVATWNWNLMKSVLFGKRMSTIMCSSLAMARWKKGDLCERTVTT